jgi:hypothetical protein
MGCQSCAVFAIQAIIIQQNTPYLDRGLLQFRDLDDTFGLSEMASWELRQTKTF